MFSKELCYQAMGNETSPEYEEQVEERRLSFCDLPTSGDSASAYWEVMNSEDNNFESSCSTKEAESFFFDFFSSGFSFTSPPANVVFCGRQLNSSTINYGDGESTASHQKKNSNKLKASSFKKKVFHWMIPFSSIFSRASTKQRKKKQKQRNEVRSCKGPDQISISSSKSSSRRWWMLMLGSTRVPSEMELADIKTRQRRRPPEAKKAFVAMFEDYEQQRNKGGMEKRSSVNGLIGLVRSFSCNGYFSGGIPAVA